MQHAFAEYREITVTDPLRQGDVLEATDDNVSMWQRTLVVLTADCDLAFDKHQGRVTCVPLIRDDDYLQAMHVPRLREKLVKKPLTELRTLLEAAGAPSISEQRLREWPSEEDPSDILSRLNLDGTKASVALAALRAIRMIDTTTPTLRESIEMLVEAQLSTASPPKRENALKNVVGPLREAYGRPPGDALFLSTVGPTHNSGYFVYLRHLEQIWEAEIATGPGRREVRYRRISRLQDRFTHAVVQRFAMVFMSIGLPKEYEDMRDLHAETFGEGFE